MHEGILEIPNDSKFWKMPFDHFDSLVMQKGYLPIMRALVTVYNCTQIPKMARHALRVIRKLHKKYKKGKRKPAKKVNVNIF